MPLTGFSALRQQITDRILASDDSGLGNGPLTYIRKDGTQILLTYVNVQYELLQEEGESGTIGEVHTIMFRVRKVDLSSTRPDIEDKAVWENRTYSVQKDIEEDGEHYWMLRAVSRHVEYRGVTGASGGGRR